MLIFGIENQLNLFERDFCLKNINEEEQLLLKIYVFRDHKI